MDVQRTKLPRGIRYSAEQNENFAWETPSACILSYVREEPQTIKQAESIMYLICILSNDPKAFVSFGNGDDANQKCSGTRIEVEGGGRWPCYQVI